jgi:hypothetical protein
LDQGIREYSQILSGLIIGLCSLGGAVIISGGVERGLEGTEDIVVTAQGFNSPQSTNRLALAHNYGERTGTLIAGVGIVVSDAQGNERDRFPVIFNPGIDAGTSPFTIPRDEGRRYFLPRPEALPAEAESCVLEYQVMQREGDPRTATSPPFECSADLEAR